MKKLFMVSLAMLSGIALNAAPLGQEAPIRSYGTPTTVTVSTLAWTLVPTASSLDGRSGLIVDAPATLNANVVGHIGDCTSTAIATTVRPIEIVKGEQSLVLPLSPTACLWLFSLHTAPEAVHVQEYKQ